MLDLLSEVDFKKRLGQKSKYFLSHVRPYARRSSELGELLVTHRVSQMIFLQNEIVSLL